MDSNLAAAEVNRAAIVDLLLELKQAPFRECATSIVEGSHLMMVDSHIAGCVLRYRDFLEAQGPELPAEHQRYLEAKLPFLERLVNSDIDDGCKKRFTIWMELVKIVLRGLADSAVE